MPNPQLERIVQLMRARGGREDMTIEQARIAMEAIAAILPLPQDVTVEPVQAAGIPSAWVGTPESEPDRVICYLHGGGYGLGSIKTHQEMVSRIARASRSRALILEYRLAPENPFPAGLEDAVKGYRWLLSNGADPATTVIAGDSAGGGLTLATLLALRDAGDPLPAAGVCISPWTDMAVTGDSVIAHADTDPWFTVDVLKLGAEMYLGGADPRNPLASPLYAKHSGLPPLLIHAGGAEMLLDDSTRLAEKAQAAGVDVTLEVWPEMIHVWHGFAVMLPEGQQAIDRIGAFVRERTGVPQPA